MLIKKTGEYNFCFQIRRHPPDYSGIPSPEGSYLAFISTRDGLGNIYLMHIKGDYIKQITKEGYIDFSPIWLHLIEYDYHD